ncbi:MAG: 7TM domain-containing protein [Candidatus Sumerlaeia bacterium]|nr:7TM domain-containing protein [Candidatus Sumerlaeia bacterium]
MLRNFGGKELLIALAICALTAVIIAYKVVALDYTPALLEPEDGYSVRLSMDVQGSGGVCDIKVTLPISSDRQTVLREGQNADGFRYTISPGRVGRWYAKELADRHSIAYYAMVQTQAAKYPLPQDEAIPTTYTLALQANLAPEERIESEDPAIVAKARELAPPGTDVRTTIERLYDFAYQKVTYIAVKGPSEATTALALGEASCNGKNRLLVAMLRASGIPARMANGLILENAGKRTTHAWSEAWVDGRWIPLCPTNGYFAEIPEKYLELAKGDVSVITRSKNVGFDWRWRINRQLSQPQRVIQSNAENPLNVLQTWTALKEYHISYDLIMVILMIPIGATIVALARNVVGVVPFGTFMPTLVAVSFRETGFLLGALAFFAVMLVAAAVNASIMRLRLLHIPRLAIIITFVVMSILLFSVVSIRLGFTKGAAISLFPMAILSLTSERFTMTILVDGWRAAIRRTVTTFFVAAACYAAMRSTHLQIAIVAFPELLLANVAANLVIGSWTGLRLTEYRRFRALADHDNPVPE